MFLVVSAQQNSKVIKAEMLKYEHRTSSGNLESKGISDMQCNNGIVNQQAIKRQIIEIS